MKNCKCGQKMEDWMTLCKDCFGKSLDNKPENKDRQESIERQVAAKCTAQAIQGAKVTDIEVKNTFKLFLDLIKG